MAGTSPNITPKYPTLALPHPLSTSQSQPLSPSKFGTLRNQDDTQGTTRLLTPQPVGRGLSELASIMDAMEATKLGDTATIRDFISHGLFSVMDELNLPPPTSYKAIKSTLEEEHVPYALLHRALRELITERQACAQEVEDTTTKFLERDSQLQAELHHTQSSNQAMAEKLRITEANLQRAMNKIEEMIRKKRSLKEMLQEEREYVHTLLKQKLNTENLLDSSNAQISTLSQVSSIYEAKLADATDKLLGLTKQRALLENKNNIATVSYENKISNLAKANQERKESLERSHSELADMSRQNQTLKSQLAAAQEQLNHLTERIAARQQSDLKAIEASKRFERERMKIDAPTGVVTLVFTDVEGSTAQWEANPEIMTLALEIHFKIMRELLQSAGGYECKTEGDAFMIAFQSPLAAVHWCMFVQEALLVADWPPGLLNLEHSKEERSTDGRVIFRGLRVRIGVHTGTPQCHLDPVSKRMDYFGPMVNRAARVAGLPHGGQVVVSGRTWREIEADVSGVEVQHLGEFTLKGIKGTEQIIQLLPSTLAGRKFPPLQTSRVKEPHFETEKDHSFPVKEPEVKESKAPTEEDELELHALPPALGLENSHLGQIVDHAEATSPQSKGKIRELANRYVPEGLMHGEFQMVISEVERQLRVAWESADALRASKRAMVAKLTDMEGRLASIDELEAEAAEWHALADKLRQEQRVAEERVNAERSEKEFFLRKLLETVPKRESASALSASSVDSDLLDMDIEEFVALDDHAKAELFERARSHMRVQSPAELQPQLQHSQSEKSNLQKRVTINLKKEKSVAQLPVVARAEELSKPNSQRGGKSAVNPRQYFAKHVSLPRVPLPVQSSSQLQSQPPSQAQVQGQTQPHSQPQTRAQTPTAQFRSSPQLQPQPSSSRVQPNMPPHSISPKLGPSKSPHPSRGSKSPHSTSVSPVRPQSSSSSPQIFPSSPSQSPRSPKSPQSLSSGELPSQQHSSQPNFPAIPIEPLLHQSPSSQQPTLLDIPASDALQQPSAQSGELPHHNNALNATYFQDILAKETLEAQLVKLNSEYAALKSSSTKKIATLLERIKKLEDMIKLLNEELELYKQKVLTTGGEDFVAALQEKRRAWAADLEELAQADKRQILSLQDQLQALENKMQSLQKENSELEAAVRFRQKSLKGDKQTSLGDSKKKLKPSTSTTKKLEAERQREEQIRYALIEEKAALASTHKAKLEEIHVQLTSLEGQSQLLAEKNKELLADKSHAVAKVKLLEAQLSKLTQQPFGGPHTSQPALQAINNTSEATNQELLQSKELNKTTRVVEEENSAAVGGDYTATVSSAAIGSLVHTESSALQPDYQRELTLSAGSVSKKKSVGFKAVHDNNITASSNLESSPLLSQQQKIREPEVAVPSEGSVVENFDHGEADKHLSHASSVNNTGEFGGWALTLAELEREENMVSNSDPGSSMQAVSSLFAKKGYQYLSPVLARSRSVTAPSPTDFVLSGHSVSSKGGVVK